MNIFGKNIRMTLLGSSHGNLVGVTIDGVPPGKKIDTKKINLALHRRRPGQSKVTTDRKEEDRLIIESGIHKGITNNEPILAYVRNKDIDSSYYDEIKETPRPGHADYPAFVKYKGYNDHRGGGRFTGRLTIGLVIAGEIARQILEQENIRIVSYTKTIGPIESKSKILEDEFIYSNENLTRTCDPEKLDEQIKYIMELKRIGDSCGGIVETMIIGLPVGVGEPWFDSIESSLSHIIFSIPAVKGIEFGKGFEATRMKGSEHNDPYEFKDGEIITTTNNAGGILGGLSNSMPIIFRTGFKPTSSIKINQRTINKLNNEQVDLKVRGRHDPCIVPRAVPVVSAASCFVILDLLITGGFLK